MSEKRAVIITNRRFPKGEAGVVRRTIALTL